MNRNGVLDPYEDWRLTPETELTDSQKELMRKPSFVRALRNFFQAAWNGEPYPVSIDMSELTPDEKRYLSDEKTITAFVAYMMERTGSVQSYNGTSFKASGARDFGEESAQQRFRASARRILLNMFRVGLFENPYLDPEETVKTVGNPGFMEEGYQAQVRSLVLLKNTGNRILPQSGKKKVWFPKKHFPAIPSIWGGMSEDHTDYPMSPDLVSRYYDIASRPAEADFALVVIDGPSISVGWDAADVKRGGNGYLPISLQYGPYTARNARAESIAGGHHTESFTNRSYKGKTVTARNYDDLLLVRETKAAMGEKPVVVVLRLDKPAVVGEFEPFADAILVSFGVQNQAVVSLRASTCPVADVQ